MERLIARDNSNESIYKEIFLQDIHIFSLSNLLKRPIIILSLPIIKDSMPSFIRGIYLPLLCQPSECIKEPIVIAYHDFHFCPLVYVYNSEDDNRKSETCGIIGDVFRDEVIFELNEATNLSARNIKRTHNFIPLVYSTTESMAIHFIKKDEEKKAASLLDSYLITGFAKMQISENTEPVHVIAAKCSTNIRFEKNSIDLYLDNFNN